jgi:mannose-6-phosphate isomerase-like protein (cupin superfamily)
MSSSPTPAALPNRFTLLPDGRRESLLGVSHIYKASSAETGGTMICVEIEVPTGHGIPLHKHTREDESFYVVAGEVVIQGEGFDQPVRMSPGGFFYGPRGREHCFSNPGPAPARLLVFATPGQNLETMFGELAVLTTQGPTPEKIGEICARHGVFFAPPVA